ncbi:MAG TPA: twin-arginine translocase subunit TatC [Candidatus Limnocylindrales bacterium]|nr:twin-arginine translocase subunit TatC [Candidatus Limnocylindrales bacterium]
MTIDNDPVAPAGGPGPDPDVALIPGPAGELIAPAAPTGSPPPPSGDDGAAPAEGAVMSLVDHLSELRTRIMWSILAIALGAVVGFAAGEPIIAFLRSPLPTDQPLVFTSVGDPFAIRIRIAVVVGIILGMPVILWNLWRFIAPGLTDVERRAILPWIPAALFFFTLGVSIAYVVLPFAAAFLLSFQTPDLQALLTAREYFDFVSTMFLAFGLLMEFPILLVGLSRVGIVTSDRLTRSRRLIVLAIAVFAAAATPGGDLVSPAILGLTLYVLFEGTVLVIRRSGR